jgi:hypothetical protein
MRPMKLSVPLAILALVVVACDGDNTPGAGSGATDNSPPVSQVAPNTATQPAGNTATEAAPNTATEAAPNTATEAAPNTATQPPGTSSGSAVGAIDCMSACNHVVAMGCSDVLDADCATSCAQLKLLTACQSAAQALLTCAASASSCDAIENNCEDVVNAFDDCADGGTSAPIPPSTATCGPNNGCIGCTTTCDICTCGLERIGTYTQSEITSLCASNCSAR